MQIAGSKKRNEMRGVVRNASVIKTLPMIICINLGTCFIKNARQ